jgi:glycerophosphoryl diester phosphodiesterase
MPRISPAARQRAAKFKGLYIAHRGLHSDEIKENTAAAFKAAVDAGYGFEFDVRVSADDVPVIAHDSSLKRVFGVDRRVEEMTAAELTELGVPTLAQTLEIAGGRVPLVVELKMDDPSSKVCEVSAPLLREYKGDYCLESFHPVALMRWKKLMPGDVRGQLSATFKNPKKDRFKYYILRNLLLNIRTRPDFIAYEFKGARSLSLRLCRAVGAVSVAWTIRSQAELDKYRKYFDTFIFENFIPENHE